MKCPICSKPLIIVERNNIQFDYCVDCKGFWLDADEWFLLKEILNLNYEIKNPNDFEFVKANENIKKCPKCARIMGKININGLILDKCPAFDGIWFDQGELSKFINSFSKDKESPVVNFLGEIFSIK